MASLRCSSQKRSLSHQPKHGVADRPSPVLGVLRPTYPEQEFELRVPKHLAPLEKRMESAWRRILFPFCTRPVSQPAMTAIDVNGQGHSPSVT